MKHLILLLCVAFCTLTSMAPDEGNSGDKNFSSLLPSIANEGEGVAQYIDSVYSTLQLESIGLDKNVFFLACKGYQYMLSQNKLKKQILTICDFTQSSAQKRLYVIDMVQGIVLFNTYVSHGKKSGSEYATSFSNKTDSHKSSLGFMITGDTYSGKAGYSMKFNGMEKGINDKVTARSIVMHGSFYVNEQRVDNGGTMGRSFGCPAVPYDVHMQIIDAIKGGSCFFSYANDKWYATTSRILNAHFQWSTPAPNNTIATTEQDSNATAKF